jgi:hypothetical protein
MVISILQITTFIVYVIFIMIMFKGPLPSISDSWYRLKDKGGVWYSLFTWFCYILGISMFFQTDFTSPFFFVSGAGLTFVGVATMFKSDDYWTPKIHFGGAILGIIGALMGLGIERVMWVPTIIWATGSLTMIPLKVKNLTWWIEVLAFVCIGVGLLMTS